MPLERSPVTLSASSIVKRFKYFTPANLLLCIDCKVFLYHSNLETHLRTNHKSDGAQLRPVLEGLGPLANDFPARVGVMPYVPEIDPPVLGYMCNILECNGCDTKGTGPHISLSSIVASRRRGEAHKGFSGMEGLKEVYLQRFGASNMERPYFVVEYDPESQVVPPDEASNTAIEYIRQHLDRYDQDRAQQLRIVNAPLDSSTNTRWLIRTGIDKHLEGHDTARLRSSFDLQHSIKGKGGTLSNLCTGIKSLLKEAFRLSTTNTPGSKLSETTSAILNKFDPTSRQKLFHPLERSGTIDKYI